MVTHTNKMQVGREGEREDGKLDEGKMRGRGVEMRMRMRTLRKGPKIRSERSEGGYEDTQRIVRWM